MPTRLYLRAIERYQAREDGEELPAYTREELEALHDDDIETVAGRGAVGSMRASLGWRSPESQALLDSWEYDSRRRVERVEDGDSLELVYDQDEEEA